MTTMQALRFSAYGPPSDLKLETLPRPTPAPGEVLVKIAAAAINPSDVKIIGGVFSPSLPRTPGRDFAGVVVEGAGQEGREVWVSGAGFGYRRDGAHADYVALPAEWLSDKPANLGMAEAAAVGAPFVTAWTALMVAGQLQAGETVLITGVGGAVGRAATQIARSRGAKVLGAGRGASPGGLDHYIDTTRQDLTQEARAFTGDNGVDLALDTVGGALFEPVLKALALAGRQVAITNMGGARVSFDLADFYHNRLRLIGVDTAKLGGAEIAAILDDLRPAFESGELKPPALRTWPLRDAVAAYTTVAAGDAKAKQVLLPQS